MTAAATPATQAPPSSPGTDTPGEGGGRAWAGIALDCAGALAGAVVIFVVADVLSDGRLSTGLRRILGRRGPQPPPEPPGE